MIARSTALRRGFAVALAAVLVTSGCAAGRDSQTSNQVPSQDGTNADAGTMALRGLALLAPSSGTFYGPGSAIPLKLVLVNNGLSNDELTSITTSVAGGWASYSSSTQAALAIDPSAAPHTKQGRLEVKELPKAETPVVVPTGQRVSWGVPDSASVLVLLSSVGRVYPGDSVKMTFTFSQAGSVTTEVPVQLSSDQGDSAVGSS